MNELTEIRRRINQLRKVERMLIKFIQTNCRHPHVSRRQKRTRMAQLSPFSGTSVTYNVEVVCDICHKVLSN